MKRILVILTLFLLASCAPPPTLNEPVLVVDTGVDPETWALVPAGEFLMGQFNKEVMVDYDYEVMVTDVTNTQFADYLNAALAAGTIKIVDGQIVGYYPGDEFHAYRHEEEIHAGDWLHVQLDALGLRIVSENNSFAVIPGYENHPIVNVTWFGAQAYCQYYGWRLPTEIEWEKAARGTDGRPYPWGDEIARNNANFYSSKDPFEKLYGKQGNTTPAGFYNGKTYMGYQTQDSASPYGLYDMGGNVEQWTGNVYENQHYRYLRGGSKQFYGYNLRVWTRNNAGPYYYSPSIGFRCARRP
jgi:formylglycine-generating enzyme required for sulfatase activity